MKDLRVTVWNEFRHEKNDDEVRAIYPEGIHTVLAAHLGCQAGITAGTATLDEPEHGLTEKALESTDVLIWWGHLAHEEVDDEVVRRLQAHVLDGMGLVVLHSGHMSKIFRTLLGTTGALRWHEVGERERLWNVEPGHPITQGIGDYFELEQTEMYGERFGIPTPDKVVFISWFESGEVFRSGCVWERGHGKIFYFRPGHETYPIFENADVLRVISNAVRWGAPLRRKREECAQVECIEEI